MRAAATYVSSSGLQPRLQNPLLNLLAQLEPILAVLSLLVGMMHHKSLGVTQRTAT